MDLPEGLTARPLTAGDARAVFEVMAAQELADIGMVEIEEADIVSDWSRPSFDVAAPLPSRPMKLSKARPVPVEPATVVTVTAGVVPPTTTLPAP